MNIIKYANESDGLTFDELIAKAESICEERGHSILPQWVFDMDNGSTGGFNPRGESRCKICGKEVNISIDSRFQNVVSGAATHSDCNNFKRKPVFNADILMKKFIKNPRFISEVNKQISSYKDNFGIDPDSISIKLNGLKFDVDIKDNFYNIKNVSLENKDEFLKSEI